MLIKLEYLFSSKVLRRFRKRHTGNIQTTRCECCGVWVFHRIVSLIVMNKNIAMKCMFSASLFSCLLV